MGEEKKRLPVGVENFELIINDNYYYVDKTGLISELLRNGGMVKSLYQTKTFWENLKYEYAGTFFFHRGRTEYL